MRHLLPYYLHQLPLLTLPIPEYATPVLVGYLRLHQPLPQPILHLVHRVGDGSFVGHLSSGDRYGAVVLSQPSPLLQGWEEVVSFYTPLSPLLMTYYPLPISIVTLVLYLSPLLTNYHLSVLHPHAYSLKPLSDLTHSLGIVVPPGIVAQKYQ